MTSSHWVFAHHGEQVALTPASISSSAFHCSFAKGRCRAVWMVLFRVEVHTCSGVSSCSVGATDPNNNMENGSGGSACMMKIRGERMHDENQGGAHA